MTSCDDPRYRCEGTLVACQYAGAGCTFRGPNKKVREHQAECGFKKEGECGKMFLYLFEPKIIENEYARSRASKPDLQDSEPKEHSRTPCTLCYIQCRKRLVYILIESRTSIEHGNSRRMN